jgi:pimeloyl-ACP methyl ester carboxylesterase
MRRDDPFRRAKAETWRIASASCLAARARAVLAVDVRDLWSSCTQPALCIVFEDDRVVPRHNAEEIRRLRPCTELVAIPGDHLTVSKNHAPWKAEIMRFIEETISGGG